MIVVVKGSRSWQTPLGEEEAEILARLCAETGLTRRELAEGVLRWLDETPAAVDRVVALAPQRSRGWGGRRSGAGRPRSSPRPETMAETEEEQ